MAKNPPSQKGIRQPLSNRMEEWDHAADTSGTYGTKDSRDRAIVTHGTYGCKHTIDNTPVKQRGTV